MNHEHVVTHTRNWISSIVIGLNLCPFAERPFKNGTIRYQVTEATGETELLACLRTELERLTSSPEESLNTTFLIHPDILMEFFAFNSFFTRAEKLIMDMNLKGIIQIVGFHPDYQFRETTSQAAQNYTNRSPYPMLHLLREDSISAVADSPDQLAEIPKRNIRTLETLGVETILAKLKACVPK